MASHNLELLEFISTSNINFIISKTTHSLALPIINTILTEYGLNQKKNIYMYCLEKSKTSYLINLISSVTGIDKMILHNYNSPCDIHYANNKETLKENEYIKYLTSMKILIESNLLIEEYTDILKEDIHYQDPLDRILLEDKAINYPHIILIDSLSQLIEKSKYKEEAIIERIKDYANKYQTIFLIFDNWNKFTNTKNIDNIITITKESNELVLEKNHNEILSFNN